ncbi:BrnT family toxin [Stappia sp.]|uniref:BrnT family toxin n=1 Tax=Stappia sp. TaxID=1870903 RepID=UPI003D0BBFEB
MQFEWDEDKRQQILKDRGVDILDAALMFENAVITKIDDRQDYGEERFISLGMADGECYVVVHTERNGNIRLITAWKGGRNDRKEYKNRFAG